MKTITTLIKPTYKHRQRISNNTLSEYQHAISMKKIYYIVSQHNAFVDMTFQKLVNVIFPIVAYNTMDQTGIIALEMTS
jgi:hypothetical protein